MSRDRFFRERDLSLQDYANERYPEDSEFGLPEGYDDPLMYKAIGPPCPPSYGVGNGI